MVVIDATKGPVLIDRDAWCGPSAGWKGRATSARQPHPGRETAGGSIGPKCRVGGEVEASIVHGHSNKAHEGFLGHSYVGEWVNLGAGTQVSDLRNDYGAIAFRIGGRTVDSGLLKVGAFLGDHAKTSSAPCSTPARSPARSASS